MQILDPTGKLLGWFFGPSMISADGRSVRLLPLVKLEKLPTDIIPPQEARVLDLPLAVIPFYKAERTELNPNGGKQYTQRTYAIAERLPEDFWTTWDAIQLTEEMLRL